MEKGASAMKQYLVTVAVVLGIIVSGGVPADAGAQAVEGRAAHPQFYQAAGVKSDTDLARLREALGKAPGVNQVQGRLQADGSALVRVLGEAKPETLVAAAKAVGFDLKPAARTAGPGDGRMLFAVGGAQTPQDEAKLRQALGQVEGIGEFQLRQTPRGLMLGIQGGKATPEAIVAAAKAAGLDLRPAEGARGRPGGPGGGQDGERITPAARGERIAQDLTAVGDPAPDFTLITRDGKAKVTLSDYRGKKPVVLIFGSYT
jgi:hypothetical protein